MRLEYLPLSPRGAASVSEAKVICLGNFDGVHLGHRTLLRAARNMRDREFLQAACGVFCFREHPSAILTGTPVPSLCTLEQKSDRFRDEGMDFAYIADFEEIRQLSPEAFVKEVLLATCHATAAVCGFNYHYGKGGKGTAESLLHTPEFSRVLIIEDVQIDGTTVSSTQIRALLASGNVELAAEFLTQPYGFVSPVLHGKALGRHLGAPTINQRFPDGMQIPRYGVYITSCEVDGVSYRGVSNVGVHPTVDAAGEINCETYLLDFDGNLYGKEVAVSFLHFLRGEQKFESREELIKQITLDIKAARQF